MSIRFHIHDRTGHRVLDAGAQGLQPSSGTSYGGIKPTGRPPQRAKAIDQPPPQRGPGGMTHEMASQQHEAAAQHHVGLNFGQQNPISRAHTEAAKAHKTAGGLFGKPGYQQAANWAMSASQHAGRMSTPAAPADAAPPPQVRQGPPQTGPDIKAGTNRPQPPPQRPQPVYRGYDYGTAEGAAKRNQGVSRPGAPGYNRPRPTPAPTPSPTPARSAGTGPTQPALHPAERQRMAARLAHLQQAASNPFTGRQHEAEIRQLRATLQNRDAAASPRAPGTPKPPKPPTPQAPPKPRSAGSTAPPKPPQPKPPGSSPPKKPPAPKGPTVGQRLGAAPGAAAHVAATPFHGVQRVAEGLNRLQEFGQHLSNDSGTSIGGRRGHSTRRHRTALDETEERRDWSNYGTIDAWFYRDEVQHAPAGGSGKYKGGQFLPGGQGGGGGAAEEGGEKRGSKSERRFQGEYKGRPPGRGAQQQTGGEKSEEKPQKASKKESPAKSLFDQQEKLVTPDEFYDPANGHLSQDEVNAIAEVKERLGRGYRGRGKGVDTQQVHKPGGKLEGRAGHEIYKGGEYTASRKRKHREILNELFSDAALVAALPAEGEKPSCVMLGGRGGSGKSNFTDGVLYPDGHRDPPIVDKKKHILIDSDWFKGKLGSDGWDAAHYHEEATDLVDMAMAQARKLGLNTILDATMKSMGSAERNLNAFEEAGYNLKGYYMHTPLAVAARNSVNRFKKKGDYSGRFVPPEYILDSKTNEETFDALRHRFSDWAVWRNQTGKDPKPYAAKGDAD